MNNSIEIFKSITYWIDQKYAEFPHTEQKLEEKFYLTYTYWYDGWVVKLNEDIIMTQEDSEWDDETNDYVDVKITLEKKFKKHINWYKQIADKFN